MKPVDQQVMHDPENGQYGDCMRACIASLLEFEPEQVPHFLEDNDDIKFGTRLNQFLTANGVAELTFPYSDVSFSLTVAAPAIYHMIYGKTERGTNHAVVAKNGVMVHDPHPSRAGLLQEDKENWVFAFLIKTCVTSDIYKQL